VKQEKDGEMAQGDAIRATVTPEVMRLDPRVEAAGFTVPLDSRAYQSRSEDDLRRVVSTLCHFIWHRTLRPGEHLWSIPADRARDFDFILGDGISELVELRTQRDELLAALKDLLDVWTGDGAYMPVRLGVKCAGGADLITRCDDAIAKVEGRKAEPSR
jgi:hypothetical protein